MFNNCVAEEKQKSLTLEITRIIKVIQRSVFFEPVV